MSVFVGWGATWNPQDNQQQSSIQLVAGSIVWVSMKAGRVAASGLIERNMKSIMELCVTPRRFKV